MKAHQVVALYRGHLVDDGGAIVISCPHTEELFKKYPQVRRPFSKSHAAKVNRMRINHMIDGSHHTCSTFDNNPDRCGVPWGSCLNSSVTEAEANCRIMWCASPHLSQHRQNMNKNDNDLVGFIVTKRFLEAGVELIWCYSVAQAYRNSDLPSTPPSKAIKATRTTDASQAAAFRCEGCECNTPCSSIGNCLTPRLNLSKRTKKLELDLSSSLPPKAIQAIRINASEAAVFRCEGCQCSSPCASTAHCLTPQLNMPKRVKKEKTQSSV
jgi:hypothetical protein